MIALPVPALAAVVYPRSAVPPLSVSWSQERERRFTRELVRYNIYINHSNMYRRYTFSSIDLSLLLKMRTTIFRSSIILLNKRVDYGSPEPFPHRFRRKCQKLAIFRYKRFGRTTRLQNVRNIFRKLLPIVVYMSPNLATFAGIRLLCYIWLLALDGDFDDAMITH